MFVGALELDVLLGDVHSLKQKRSVVRPVLAELRRRFEVAVAEAGPPRPAPARAARGQLCGRRLRARHRGARPVRAARRRPPGAGAALGPAPDAGPGGRSHGSLQRSRSEHVMVDHARARRLAKRITQIVAAALEHEVKDPRLTMVTITDTRVTGDLREATVYYTVLGETVDADPDTAGAAAALASATGVLRSMVGRRHRDPAHPVAGVRAGPGAGRGPPHGGAARPHPRVRRRGGPAGGRGPARRATPIRTGPRGSGTSAGVERDARIRPVDAELTPRRLAQRSRVGGRGCSAGARHGHAAGARRPGRRRAGQRAGAGHRPAPARRGGAGVVRDAGPGARVAAPRSTCSVWWSRRRRCRRRRRCWSAATRPSRRRLGPLARPAGHRRTHGDDRPPRAPTRVSATCRCSTRAPRRRWCSCTGVLVAMRRAARRRRGPLPLRRAGHRHPGLPHRRTRRAPAGRRAGRRRAPNRRPLTRTADGHPPVRLARRARAALDRAVLEPARRRARSGAHDDPAGGRPAVPHRGDRQRRGRAADGHGGRGGGVRDQAGRGAAVAGVAALRPGGRRRRGRRPAGRRRAPCRGRLHRARAPSEEVARRAARRATARTDDAPH